MNTPSMFSHSSFKKNIKFQFLRQIQNVLNILLILVIFLLSYILGMPKAFSKTFHISPYVIKSNNQELILKYELESPKALNLEIIKVNGGHVSRDVEFLPEDEGLIMTNLGSQGCGDFFELNLFTQDQKKVYASNVHYFPCDKDETFKFGFYSDTQQSPKKHLSIASVMAGIVDKQRLNFVINAGDIVQTGKKESHWYKFFNVARLYLKNVPLVAVIGNHDYRDKKTSGDMPVLFNKYLRHPESIQTGQIKIEFPQFHLIVFNSNFKDIESKTMRKQWVWFDKELKKSKARNIPVFLTFHHSPICSAFSCNSKVEKILKAKLLPRIEKSKQIKLILTGHTHYYERSIKDGVTYLVAGPAGGIKNILGGSYNPYSIIRDRGAVTFTLLEVEDKQVKFKTYDKDSSVIDSANIML